jgi:hypothetical protein
MSQRPNIEKVLEKLNKSHAINYAEKRVLATALRGLTGCVESEMAEEAGKRATRRKVWFFTNDAAFKRFQPDRQFQHYNVNTNGAFEARDSFNKPTLFVAYNFARYRLFLCRGTCKDSPAQGKPFVVAECVAWMRRALDLQAMLCEIYDKDVEKWSGYYLSRYPRLGMTLEDLIGPVRAGVISAINTFDIGRISFEGESASGFDRLMSNRLFWCIKTKVANEYIRNIRKVRQNEVMVSQTLAQENEDYFGLMACEELALMPEWLLELLSGEQGNPLEEAFRRSLIYRAIIERGCPENGRLVKQEECALVQAMGAVQTVSPQSTQSFDQFGCEMVPSDWRMAWLRRAVQGRLAPENPDSTQACNEDNQEFLSGAARL